jgi:predicted nucleic acid-binding protein
LRYFFDTSVLVPALLDEHPHHAASLSALLRANKKNACCAVHSLAEVYSTLTHLPRTHRVSGDQAMLFLGDLVERLTLITLDALEYWSAISDAAAQNISGGTIYDALLARCALKSRVDILYTWNVGDFERLGTEVASRVRTP